MPRLVLVLAMAALGGCTHLGADAADCDSLTTRLDRLKAQVEAEIGDATAGTPASCRAIAFGAKPCGGPWTYLVYSTESSDVAKIQLLVQDYRRLDEERNETCGLASNCMLEPMPEAVLEGGRCVADYSAN